MFPPSRSLLAILFVLLQAVFSYGQTPPSLGVKIETDGEPTFNEAVSLGTVVVRGGTSSPNYVVPHVGAEIAVETNINDIITKEWILKESSLTPSSTLISNPSRCNRDLLNNAIQALELTSAATGVTGLSSRALDIFGVDVSAEARLVSKNLSVSAPASSFGSATSTEYGDLKARAQTNVNPDVFFIEMPFQERTRSRVELFRHVDVFFDHPESFSFTEIVHEFSFDAVVSKSFPGGKDLDDTVSFSGGVTGSGGVRAYAQRPFTPNKTETIQATSPDFENSGGSHDFRDTKSITIDLRRTSPTRSLFRLDYFLDLSSQSIVGENDINSLGTFSLDSFYFENGVTPEEMGLELVFSDGAISPNLKPFIGDCNQDGVVDFADIPAFISTLISGEYLAEADIDQDGDVDFFDIPLFIELLQGA